MDASLFEDRSLKWAAALGLVAILIIALFHINSIYYAVGPVAVFWAYDITLVLFALAGAALAMLMWRSFAGGGVLKTIWGSMGLGLLLWTIGEAIWAYDELIAQEELPYPSVADLAFVVGYIPLFVALFLRYRSLRAKPNTRWLAGTLGAFVVIMMLAIVLVIGPIVTYPEYDSPIEQLLDALYPIGDLGIALGVLLIVLALSGGTLSVPWALIAAGFLVVSAADLLFAYGTWNEIYLGDPDSGINLITALSDVPYYASYVLIAFGTYMQARLRNVL